MTGRDPARGRGPPGRTRIERSPRRRRRRGRRRERGADALLAEDGYKAETRKRQMRAHERIITAAKLIGPHVARTPRRGRLLAEEMQSAGYASLAHELEMEKALAHLKTRRFTPGAFEEGKRGLRAFEKKDDRLRAKAATNLAFLYYQEGDVENAATYADLSVRANKYSEALNGGVVSWRRGNVSGAQEMFEGAVRLEADCVEAVYNLGLVQIAGEAAEALAAFEKVRRCSGLDRLFNGNVAELVTFPKPSRGSRRSRRSSRTTRAFWRGSAPRTRRWATRRRPCSATSRRTGCTRRTRMSSAGSARSTSGARRTKSRRRTSNSPPTNARANRSGGSWRRAATDARESSPSRTRSTWRCTRNTRRTSSAWYRACAATWRSRGRQPIHRQAAKAERDAGGGASTRAGPPPTLLGGLGGEEMFGGIGLGRERESRGSGVGASSGTWVGGGGAPLRGARPLAPVAEPPSPTPPTPSAPGAPRPRTSGAEGARRTLPGCEAEK